MNDFLSSGTEPTIKMTRVERPSATVFMAETADTSPVIVPRTIRAFFGGGDPSSGPDNEANLLFCDGHIESKKRKDFADPKALSVSPIDPGFTFMPYPEALSQ
jgi:prepilin-type processing-associated H-X9-DG protein